MLGHSDEKTILKYYCFDTYTEIEKMNLMENALKISWIHCIQVGIYFKRCKKDVRKLFGDMHKSPQTRINTEFSINKEKHRPRSSYVCKNSVFSAPSGARTLDTLIKSQVLYQLS